MPETITPVTSPETVTSPESQSPSPPPSPRRWLRKVTVTLGCVLLGIIFYGIFIQKRELGADWFAPMNPGTQKNEKWEEVAKPPLTFPTHTNDTLDLKYEVVTDFDGTREIKVTTDFGEWLTTTRFEYADLIKADADNVATLPNGATARLGEVIAFREKPKLPLFFKLDHGVSTQVTVPATAASINKAAAYPHLGFRLEQKPAGALSHRYYSNTGSVASDHGQFSLFESSTNRHLGSGYESKEYLFCYNMPHMPQAAVNLVMACDFDGTQQFTIPMVPGSFVEKNGGVIRYCGDVKLQPNEAMRFGLYYKTARYNGSVIGTSLKPETNTGERVFAFTHSLYPLEIRSVEAVLENGEKILLRSKRSFFCISLFLEPSTLAAPIQSFIVTLPKRSARILFTIPQIPELWPDQKVANRFDLRFSATEAAHFKQSIHSRYYLEKAVYRITGAKAEFRKSASEPSMSDVDFTGKTFREVLSLYLQRSGENPDDYVTVLDQRGNLLFEYKKPWGVYAWRWLYRHPSIYHWTRQVGIYPWFEKIGIKPDP